MPASPKRVALLGATGSIGTQALQVIQQHPEQFQVTLLTAQRNVALLVEQARAFRPSRIVIGDVSLYAAAKEGLSGLPIEVLAGSEALAQAVTADDIDLVLTALVGFAGLPPTYNAIRAGKTIALANKETLVVAGQLITAEAERSGVKILPVDSEHSAIFQCLVGEALTDIEKIYLTASGGPFRGFSAAQLEQVSLAQALKHPNWNMGAKITIDSASMMNKGLEVIEAHWLFGLEAQQIDIVVHPQSIVHSLVQFTDGSMKAQLGTPDMRTPIQYALTYPGRLVSSFTRFDFTKVPTFTFEQVDRGVFRTVALAYAALAQGGNAPCVLNAANEVAVAAVLAGSLPFHRIFDVLEQALAQLTFIAHPTLDDLYETDRLTREQLATLLLPVL